MDAHERKQALESHYSEDRTTLMQRVGSSASGNDNSKLKRSVLRIMDRLMNMGEKKPETEPTAKRTDPTTIALPPEAVQTPSILDDPNISTSKSITYEYIQMRFSRSIALARANQDHDEVLRLQRLLTLMERGEVHPVQAARHAWLNPAFRERLTKK